MDKAKAREDLSKSNEQVEENNSRIKQQEEQLKQLAAHGHETGAVQGQLKDLKQEKESIERHRDLVQEDLNEKLDEFPKWALDAVGAADLATPRKRDVLPAARDLSPKLNWRG